MDIFKDIIWSRHAFYAADRPPGRKRKYKRWWKRLTNKYARRQLKKLL